MGGEKGACLFISKSAANKLPPGNVNTPALDYLELRKRKREGRRTKIYKADVTLLSEATFRGEINRPCIASALENSPPR